jgi:DNA-binding response OmpR family regulator
MHIAVIEDEQKLAHAIKQGLEDEGYAIDVFYNGEVARKHLETNHVHYDLIILDLLLPGLSGIKVCQALRSKNIITPILILTALDTIEDKVQALDSGADDLLTKPFSFEELLARIRALLRRSQELLPATLQLGEMVLDPAQHEVMRKGKKITLTLKEFQLLHYFMRHPNQALQRKDILAHLWGITDEALSNMVDVHISNLRKKIDDPYDKKYIRAVRGVGYLMGE